MRKIRLKNTIAYTSFTSFLGLLTVFLVAQACHSSKKATTGSTIVPATSSSPSNTVATTATTGSVAIVRNGIIPGDLELTVIKVKYPDVTAQNLNNGHELYIGKCTDCHRKKNIFVYTEQKWEYIIDDMAQRSKLSAQEKDDLYKYVLSMKATQNMYAK